LNINLHFLTYIEAKENPITCEDRHRAKRIGLLLQPGALPLIIFDSVIDRGELYEGNVAKVVFITGEYYGGANIAYATKGKLPLDEVFYYRDMVEKGKPDEIFDYVDSATNAYAMRFGMIIDVTRDLGAGIESSKFDFIQNRFGYLDVLVIDKQGYVRRNSNVFESNPEEPWIQVNKRIADQKRIMIKNCYVNIEISLDGTVEINDREITLYGFKAEEISVHTGQHNQALLRSIDNRFALLEIQPNGRAKVLNVSHAALSGEKIQHKVLKVVLGNHSEGVLVAYQAMDGSPKFTNLPLFVA